MSRPRIYLSPPHLSGRELPLVKEVFRSNWIAPLGPQVDKFEEEFAAAVGAKHALALSSGTAALHLALQLVGVSRDDEVLVSTLTFAASVNPILYLGGFPVFIDSELRSWNMDPALLAQAIEERATRGRLPKAVVLVHLYGQSADINPIKAVCDRHGVALIEDAAEALGATYRTNTEYGMRNVYCPEEPSRSKSEVRNPKSASPGTFGRAGVFSFNGNKILTTSGGGMLVSNDRDFIAHARKLATQAREPFIHYEHTEIGYNYRMSNILAAVGRGQLAVLADRVNARRRNFDYYRRHLGDLPGIGFMPEASWGRATRWLTCVIIDPTTCGVDREAVRLALETEDIESRPVWKPMHLQPVFAKYETFGGEVAAGIFDKGLCLPSGSSLAEADLNRVVAVMRSCVMG